MRFEVHKFDTSQFVVHKYKNMSHNLSCYYSVRHKGTLTGQATLLDEQPDRIKNKAANKADIGLLQFILPHSSFIIPEATWQKYPK